jgi:N-acetyl-gamma-glutamyl-phosphate reductase
MTELLRVAIIGATGYSGAELVGLLLKHPHANLHTLMTANRERQAGKPRKYSEELPQFDRRCDLEIEPLDVALLSDRGVSVVFLATPNETSHELVPRLLERDLRVIDLSGAYRLRQANLYTKWYGFEHRFPSLLDQAVYGLTEIQRRRIRQTRLLANPGCYPT